MAGIGSLELWMSVLSDVHVMMICYACCYSTLLSIMEGSVACWKLLDPPFGDDEAKHDRRSDAQREPERELMT